MHSDYEQREQDWIESTAKLESQLAEAEKTIGALKHRIGEIEDERGAEIARLRGALDAYRSEEHERHCAWRDLTCDDLCHRCHGAGIRAYGSTATWRGGIGGQAITSDVCDACWGSGSKSRKWPSHRLAPHGRQRSEGVGVMKRDAKHVACEGAEEILWAKYKARGAEITRLRGEILFKDDAINGLHGAYSTAADEITRLRKALVWAVKNDVEALGIGPVDIFRYGTHIATCRDNDASLIETLCKLAEGE